MYNQISSNKRKTWLMVALFVLLLGAIGYAASLYTGQPPFSTIGIALIISLAMTLVSFYAGDSIALSAAGAHAVTRNENPYLHRLVENLCITAGIKTVPKLYVIQDSAINAFATGRDPAHASIAVTTGAMEKLENEELEGVLAHELSHITNYDIRLMTVVVVLVGVIALIADMMRFARPGGGDNGSNRGPSILAIVGLVLIILSPLIAELIKLAVSRRREYLADASGALLTRYPEGLARALEKIRDSNRPMEHRNHATAHLFFESPFRSPGKKLASWFSTHPPIDERIAELRKAGG